MRKKIILTTALSLTLALTGAGCSAERRSTSSEESNTETAESTAQENTQETETAETAQTEALEALEMPEAESELLVPETSGLEEAAPLETLE